MKLTRYLFLINIILGAILIFSPIIWMEIGPLGKAYYGPTVPDIYIYGGYITGKDLRWAPIYGAMIFQRAFILAGIGLMTGAWICSRNNTGLMKACIWVTSSLLLSFPMWISMYSGHVINNSDGAAGDLTVHWGIGMYIYGVLVLVQLAVHVSLFIARARNNLNKSKSRIFYP